MAGDNKIKDIELYDMEKASKIISGLKVRNRKISKYDFEVHLLPYILGEVVKTDVNDAVFIKNYLSIAKSHHTGIDVIGDDGEVVFKLPPLLLETGIEKLTSINFALIASKVKTFSESSPHRADALLVAVSEAVSENIEIKNDEQTKELVKILLAYSDRVVYNNDGEGGGRKNTEVEDEEELFDY